MKTTSLSRTSRQSLSSRCGRAARAVLAAFLLAAGVSPALADEAKALERRARAGEVAAQYELGRRLDHGIGARAHAATAARWYRLAAEKGHAPAQYSLGRLCAAGEGVRQNQAVAAQWFQRAAAQGYVPAQNRLGRAYELGRGVPQDLSEACKWYALAADAHPSARVNQLALTARLTGTQLAEAQSRASTFLAGTAAGHPGR